jgi:prepilin-type processing-associated H-X9-DG protein
MYSGESNGVFPAIQLEAPDGVTGEIWIAAGPMVSSIYPEYLTDPAILLCPSDPNDTAKDLKSATTGQWNIQDHFRPNGSKVGGQEGVCAVDVSYVYFGWVFDRCDDDPAWVGPVGANAPLLSTLVDNLDPTQNGPLQFLTGINWMLTQAVGNGDKMRDADLEATNGTINYGNGGGKTVYRMREGIERFLITDINNAASSALAQSNLFVMLDTLSSEVGNFNHVPGGCNVLYMDGHVEFLKYPGKGPVSKAMATVASAISS